MRILSRLLAFIVAVALVGTSVIVIVEVIAESAGSAPLIINWHSILEWGQRNTWKATSVELACACTAAAGLILLVPQLRRRRPNRFALDLGEATDAALTRQGVAVTVRGAVEDVEGVSRTRVKVGHRRIRVDAVVSATEPAVVSELEPKVEEAATNQLEALRLRPGRRVHVAVTGSRNGDG